MPHTDYNLAIVWNNTDFKVYSDGVLIKKIKAVSLPASFTKLVLGARIDGTNLGFQDFKKIRYYNTPLSDRDIRKISLGL